MYSVNRYGDQRQQEDLAMVARQAEVAGAPSHGRYPASARYTVRGYVSHQTEHDILEHDILEHA